MAVNLWRLPGPTRYVQTIFQELRSGKNVVMVFPRHASSGIREALAERVREVDLWRWRTINATEFPCDGVAGLMESLHEKFVPARNPSDLCTAMKLAERLVGTIVWVENTTGQVWETAPVKVLIFCRFRTYVRILPRCSRESVRWCSHDSMISYVTDGVTGSPLKQERQGCCLANGSRSLSSPAR